jgi:hydroxymethylpyrimidine kinase/phosphomethylpyrimidine kinase
MSLNSPVEPAKVLTIAGSDSGGAAGLQADLKTFSALGVYGMSVVTAVTAQNSMSVAGVHFLPPDFVTAQIKSVLSDYGAMAIKTGFIGHKELIRSIAGLLTDYKASGNHKVFVVVDPVLVNHRGETMFDPGVAQAYQTHLLPLADLVTPNLAEAELLSGRKLTGLAMIESALPVIHSFGSRWVLVKGRRSGVEMVDLLYNGQDISLIRSPYYETENTHGSGDTLSAAICSYLARGKKMASAVEKAIKFTSLAIGRAKNWRLGDGHGPLNHWANADQGTFS